MIGLQQAMLDHVNGTCGNDTVGDVLNIWLYNYTWRMSITFMEDATNIWWNDVSLHYVDDANLFTNSSGSLGFCIYFITHGNKLNMYCKHCCTKSCSVISKSDSYQDQRLT